jgi:GNAT superfamily N-acetyltransferase
MPPHDNAVAEVQLTAAARLGLVVHGHLRRGEQGLDLAAAVDHAGELQQLPQPDGRALDCDLARHLSQSSSLSRYRVPAMRFVDLEPGDPRLGEDALPVLAELRAHLTPEILAGVYEEGYPQGLRFTAVYDDLQTCVAVAGWRLMATTVALRKLYVDDLVTAAAHRSRGIGGALLGELERRARQAGCEWMDLDSAVTRGEAHRFYMREGMPITSFHFAREVR